MQNGLIRKATAADASLIAELSRATFYETFAPFNTAENMQLFMDGPFHREKLMQEVEDPANLFFLAMEGEQAVGYVKMKVNNDAPGLEGQQAIEIARIYAIAQQVGRGVGRRLMEHCLDVAAQLNMDIIWLGVWEQNRRAIDFYTRWGFEPFGTHLFQLGNDPQTDWLMKRPVQR